VYFLLFFTKQELVEQQTSSWRQTGVFDLFVKIEHSTVGSVQFLCVSQLRQAHARLVNYFSRL